MGIHPSQCYAFSKEFKDGETEPLRKGNLILDFDYEKDPFQAIQFAKNFIKSIEDKYLISGEVFNCWSRAT
jgi:hypothetical protein